MKILVLRCRQTIQFKETKEYLNGKFSNSKIYFLTRQITCARQGTKTVNSTDMISEEIIFLPYTGRFSIFKISLPLLMRLKKEEFDMSVVFYDSSLDEGYLDFELAAFLTKPKLGVFCFVDDELFKMDIKFSIVRKMISIMSRKLLSPFVFLIVIFRIKIKSLRKKITK